MLGHGKAIAATDGDLARLADRLKVHPADLEAIKIVESAGFGWFPDGRLKILFEKNWFYKLTKGAERKAAVRAGLARRKWISPKRGGYSEQAEPSARYQILSAAMKINPEMAMQSISQGSFQIMGFNYGICGFASASAMFAAMCETEQAHLLAFSRFLQSKGLASAIRARDFDKVERVYNGGGLNGRYAVRMTKHSNSLRAVKWKGYQAGSFGQSANVRKVPKPRANPRRKFAWQFWR